MNSPRPREGTAPTRVTVTPTAAGLWVRITGEADICNRDDLQTALAAIDYRSSRVVGVDLRRLTFCDSAGCLVILGFVRRARLAGCQTEMWVTNPTTRKMIAILTRDRWPGESAPNLRTEASN